MATRSFFDDLRKLRDRFTTNVKTLVSPEFRRSVITEPIKAKARSISLSVQRDRQLSSKQFEELVERSKATFKRVKRPPKARSASEKQFDVLVERVKGEFKKLRKPTPRLGKFPTTRSRGEALMAQKLVSGGVEDVATVERSLQERLQRPEFDPLRKIFKLSTFKPFSIFADPKETREFRAHLLEKTAKGGKLTPEESKRASKLASTEMMGTVFDFSTGIGGVKGVAGVDELQLGKQPIEQAIPLQQKARELEVGRADYGKEGMKLVNRVKAMARSKSFQIGDIETLRKKSPVVEQVIEKVREIPRFSGLTDVEALDKVLDVPTLKAIGEVKKEANILFREQRLLDTQEKEFIKNMFGVPIKESEVHKMIKESLDVIREYKPVKPPQLPEIEATKLKDIKLLQKGFDHFENNTKQVLGKQGQEIVDGFVSSKKGYVDYINKWLVDLKTVTKDFGIARRSKDSNLLQQFGEKTITLDELKGATKNWENIVEADKWFRGAYDTILEEVNRVRLGGGKDAIARRGDYYRHFRELSGFEGIKNLFQMQASIDPRLAGVSDYTRPTAKWLSIAQKRLGGKTKLDAVGGFLDYINQASYAKNIDPQIRKLRYLAQNLAEQTVETKNLNNYIEFLNDFTRNLSGKTSPFDRPLQKFFVSRKLLKGVYAVHTRIKKNLVVGNIRSSLGQLLSLPQSIASAGEKHSLRGAYDSVVGLVSKEDFAFKNSSALQERYLGKEFASFDKSMINNANKFVSFITGVFDEVATRTIWNSHYNQAIGGGSNFKQSVKLADSAVRRLAPGRGVGEVPLAYKSKLVDMLAPFQLEVGNFWLIARNFMSEKQYGKVVKLLVWNWAFNEVAERTYGDRVLFDPIDVLVQNTIGDDKDRTLTEKFGRGVGEVLSNVPIGQQVAGTVVPEGKREQYFGSRDPGRYGSGSLISKGIQDWKYKLLPPFGGSQLKKTIGGLKAQKEGFSKTRAGRVRYEVPEKRKLQTAIFGEYATPEAREYFRLGKAPVSEATFKKNKIAQKLLGQAGTPAFTKNLATLEQTLPKAEFNDIKRRTKILVADKRYNVPRTEQKLRNKSVQERAEYVLKKIDASKNQQETLQEYKDKLIVTDSVLKRMAEIMRTRE